MTFSGSWQFAVQLFYLSCWYQTNLCEKIEISGKISGYIASVSHALVACKLKVRPQPASFFAIVEQKAYMTVFIH